MRAFLEGLRDLGQYVVPTGVAAANPHTRPELVAWRIAADEAREAYAEWRRRRDDESYVVYCASADRADAAQAAVAST